MKLKPPERTEAPIVNRGQQILQARGGTISGIAKRVGVSRTTAQRWWRAKCRPAPPAALLLSEVYGIPVGAWEAPPGASLDVEPIPSPEPSSIPSPGASLNRTDFEAGTMGELKYTLACIDEHLASGLSPSEETRVYSARISVLAKIQKAEEAMEMSEDRFVREHPAWRDLRARILEALEPYPDAARAVLEAIDT